ncbi:MAG: hypothetical protein J1F35_04665 [Erysipelotrichales bacterium]|nr:hypothetical protein [Erysipelotrichales bacterium]
MDYINLIKQLAYYDLQDKANKEDLMVAINNFDDAANTLKLDNNLYYAIKKFLVHMSNKYIGSAEKISESSRSIYNLDDLIVRLQIPCISFIGKNLSDTRVYQTANELYDDFRVFLVGEDKFPNVRQRTIQAYICELSKMIKEEMDLIEFPDDVAIRQFKELLRLIITSFDNIRVDLHIIGNLYFRNNIYVKEQLSKYLLLYPKPGSPYEIVR